MTLSQGQAAALDGPGEKAPDTEVSQVTHDPLLSIGVFARRSRLSPKALRLYDRLGMLPPARVDQASGYRWYRESQLALARLVAMMRRLDMSLPQVSAVVSAPAARRAELVGSFWDGVERRIAGQRELAVHLRIRLAGEEGSYPMYEVKEREVPEQLVLTEQRHVQVEDLPDWIEAAMKRLLASAQGYGGPAEAPFVVYHGEVNEDSDGPVEVCVPIRPDREPVAESAIRREPAHREAYVRIPKAQVEFPQILSAYDAVAHWIAKQGGGAAGSPREVYFTDFGAAGPNDEVCDVAWPVS